MATEGLTPEPGMRVGQRVREETGEGQGLPVKGSALCSPLTPLALVSGPRGLLPLVQAGLLLALWSQARRYYRNFVSPLTFSTALPGRCCCL